MVVDQRFSDPPIIWSPDPQRVASCGLTAFRLSAEKAFGRSLSDYSTLYAWSIAEPDEFWLHLLKHLAIIGEGDQRPSWIPGGVHPMLGRWFPNFTLNFAENLLRQPNDRIAIVFSGEGAVTREVSRRTLRDHAGAVACFLTEQGVQPGDRVAAIVANTPETIACALGAAWIGATWSSCSPDFGVDATCDRFEQLAPRVLVVSDRYLHKGKWIDCLPKVSELAVRLPSVERILILPYSDQTVESGSHASSKPIHVYSEILSCGSTPPPFARFPFDHPLFILFSSGTTGKPKGIIHSTGGTLLELMKELILHTDIRPGERVFYQTTCGWMMWNWLLAALAAEATVVIYDGAPLHENGTILWRLAQETGVNVFGTNAKYLAALESEGITVRERFSIPHLDRILSTGSPLVPTGFDFIHREIKPGVQISSISGGTDILGCFALGSPTEPVRQGELQVRSLGLAVEVFDDQGISVQNELGDLVCTKPFPSTPVGFVNDPDGRRFHAAYFERFPGVWHHGDFAEVCNSGGMRIIGRSDATLNPGGIRIGTAEIYQQVEQIPGVAEALAVTFTPSQDAKFVLFLRLKDDSIDQEVLFLEVRSNLRKNLSPYHAPWRIITAPDFPRTRNGKLMELAVRSLLAGEELKNTHAIANPECIDFFRRLGAELVRAEQSGS